MYAEFFSRDYASARERFVRAAARLGATIETVETPFARGPFGERLSMDAARIGPGDADTVLVTLSGSHGDEGFCGSAAQLAWLERQPGRALPGDVAVLLVHAVNPYGFAHCLRVNENCVDLNRNAIDFSKPLPDNPLYAEIHAAVEKAERTADPASSISRQMLHFESLHGKWAVNDAVSRGQYAFPGGFHFGGFEKQWSTKTLESILAGQCSKARHVAYIDWHSLIEVSDDAFVYLCFNDTNDHLFRRAGAWWGMENISRETVNEQWSGDQRSRVRRPGRHGLLMWAAQHALAPSADLAGAVIEFCCNPRPEFTDPKTEFQIELDARRLFAIADKQCPEAVALREKLKAFSSPPQPAWREKVIPNALRVWDQALAGAAAWSAENVPADPGRLVRFSNFE